MFWGYFQRAILAHQVSIRFYRLIPSQTLKPWAMPLHVLSHLWYSATETVSSSRNSLWLVLEINPLTPNDHYSGRTAPLTSKRCILYIYSTNNIGTEYFKHGIYSPFFSSSKYNLFHNSNVFGSCIIHILYTGCAKIKKKFRHKKVKTQSSLARH